MYKPLPSAVPRVALMAVAAFALLSCDDSHDLILEFSVPTAEITVDGNRVDWQDIPPAATDAQGDHLSLLPGADAKELYIAQNPSGDTIYVMLVLWNGPPNSALASQDTSDGDTAHPNVQMGYQVFFGTDYTGGFHSELFVRFDTNLAAWALNPVVPIPINDADLAVGDVLELSFPASELPGKPFFFKANINTSAYSERRENIPDFGSWVLCLFS